MNIDPTVATEPSNPAAASENPTEEKPRRPKGFAGMSASQRQRISSLGGKAAHAKGTAHQFSTEEARRAGHKGGVAPHRQRGRGRVQKTEPVADSQ